MPSFQHLLLVLVVVVLLFGTGRISGVMGDVAKGIKSFKKGMADDDDEVPAAKPAPLIEKSGTVVDATDKQTDKQA
jgi:sec-independent protein translocase protein TatA